MIALGGGAFAADLPTRVEAPAPFIQPPVFTWTGFYVGRERRRRVQCRRRQGAARSSCCPGGFTTPPGAPSRLYVRHHRLRRQLRGDAVFTGGGQIGYNYQFANNFVLGAEADLQFLGFDDDDERGHHDGRLPGDVSRRRVAAPRGWTGSARFACAPVTPSIARWSTPPAVWPTVKDDATRFEATKRHRRLLRRTATSPSAGRSVPAVEYAWTDNLDPPRVSRGLYVSLDRDTSVTKTSRAPTSPGAPEQRCSGGGGDRFRRTDNIEFRRPVRARPELQVLIPAGGLNERRAGQPPAPPFRGTLHGPLRTATRPDRRAAQ